MNKFFLIIGTVLLAGCVTVPDETAAVGPGAGNFPKELRAVAQMWSVKPGMLKPEVRSLLDEKVIIGYETAPDSEAYVPITLNNPYRVETVKKGEKTFEVYYYFTGIKHADGKITDDELIPIVFENDQLAGNGWDFFKKSVQPRK